VHNQAQLIPKTLDSDTTSNTSVIVSEIYDQIRLSSMCCQFSLGGRNREDNITIRGIEIVVVIVIEKADHRLFDLNIYHTTELVKKVIFSITNYRI